MQDRSSSYRQSRRRRRPALRVVCGYCASEHNYRGGPRIDAPAPRSLTSLPARSSMSERNDHRPAGEPFPLVSDRERIAPPMTVDATTDLELLLRRIIREETGISPATPAEKWRGGTLVLRPGTPGLQEKTWANRDVLPQDRDAAESIADAGAKCERVRPVQNLCANQPISTR